MSTFLDQVSSNLLYNAAYDIFKFFIGYLLARLFYDRVFMRWFWGKWEVIVKRGDEEINRRKISPERARAVIKDETDLSVYIKGLVSFYGTLNIDICSREAKDSGMLNIDRGKRRLIIDLSNHFTFSPDLKW